METIAAIALVWFGIGLLVLTYGVCFGIQELRGIHAELRELNEILKRWPR